ncbi:N-acetylmuramidase domain-containing protein [Parapedobacter tibetensis]|uniref:N-acetylmuramidase domain-containing protein n=1 Tax=Parapedobacter tibetensis TaxID=2972951 RepID=UPI00214D6C4A|nr:N-acetylmuramidase domain-containing protein [Parapedobacter tibetensis]
MIQLRLNSQGNAVELLQELLNEFGHNLIVNGHFDAATDKAVREFQRQNNLVSDGIVFTKTWIRLINNVPLDLSIMEVKYLKESDITNLATRLGLDVATIKAVNEVESSGRGFNADGNPKILFEGHVFWRELKNRGINPADHIAGNQDVLYSKWTKQHYKGGKGEYERLEKAIHVAGNNSKVAEAAYASASWGLFQIMGFHYKALGYGSITEFVAAMQLDEGRHLDAFGRFLEVNGLVPLLKAKQWAAFAKRYNGAGYAANQYDMKLKTAYEKYAAAERPPVIASATTTTVLRKNDSGALVSELQTLLNELDYPVEVTGVFDAKTDQAVKGFQSAHLDKHGQPLTVDGVVGLLTWWAFQNPRPQATQGAINYRMMPAMEPGESGIGRKALHIAIEELKAGAGEVGGNNRGPWVGKYLTPAGLPEGYAWCAAFVSWCFLQAVDGQLHRMPFQYTAGARHLFNQLKNKGWSFTGTDNRQPKPGDVVCWWRTSLASGNGHIGIVHHCKDGFLYTIEGNKAANVAGFSYVKTRMDKLLGYARIFET